MGSGSSHEPAQRCDIHVIQQASGILAGGVEHDAVKAALGHEGEERVVALHVVMFHVGEQHADQLDASCQRREAAHRLGGVRRRRQGQFDEIGAGGSDSVGRDRHVMDCHAGHARDRADGPPAGDGFDDGAYIRNRPSREGVGRNILEIDDVGAMGERRQRFVGPGHARQEQAHWRTPSRAAMSRLRICRTGGGETLRRTASAGEVGTAIMGVPPVTSCRTMRWASLGNYRLDLNPE